MKFIDFFSGIGMFRQGMLSAGHNPVGFVEFNKYARQTYEQNYNTSEEWTEWDIRNVRATEMPKSDIWCAGFPCQNLSTANVTTRLGIEGEKSGLILTLIDLLEQIETKPKWLFIENVSGLVSIRGGFDFLKVISLIARLNYDVYYELSSAMKYNVPQNRIRTYIVCKKREENINYDTPSKEIVTSTKTISMNNISVFDLLDLYNQNENLLDKKLAWGNVGCVINGICHAMTEEKNFTPLTTLGDYLEETVEEKYFLTQDQIDKVSYMKGSKQRVLPDGRLWKEGAVPFPDLTTKNARCVTPSDGSLNRSTHVILDNGRYRKLTIRERARLQGLPDAFTFPVSDSQASLQIGNGVVVDVITQICSKVINENFIFEEPQFHLGKEVILDKKFMIEDVQSIIVNNAINYIYSLKSEDNISLHMSQSQILRQQQ